jgi:uncharacterized protein
MKYLLWVVLLYLAWRWYQSQKRKDEPPVAGPAVASSPAANGEPEPMVQCASCGIHLPVSEALPAPGERHYCSEAHRANHQAH